MRKLLLVFLAMFSVAVAVLNAPPAAANTYPGLHQQDWTSPYSDVLRARIAIEVNDQGQGRFRFRILCFRYTDTGDFVPQLCDMYPGTAHWYDLTTGAHYSNSNLLPDYASYDSTWTGTYRTLQNNHVYAVKESNFNVQFYTSPGYISNYHTICSYKEGYSRARIIVGKTLRTIGVPT